MQENAPQFAIRVSDLVVGFGKRRHELVLLQGDAGSHRRSLEEYSPPPNPALSRSILRHRQLRSIRVMRPTRFPSASTN